MKVLRRFLIVCFLGAIWLPFVQMSLHVFEEFENPEKREMAPPPELAFGKLAELPKGLEAYLADNFGLRNNLIRLNSILRVNLLGVSPIPSVLIGKDSWLFYSSEALDDGNTFNDYRGIIPLPESELVKARHRLEENRDRFARNGIYYLVVVVPNKNTVYGEFLPAGFNGYAGPTRLDQFMAHMRAHSDVEVLDLREALLRAKQEYPPFSKTDSHWNSYGAWVGYREIVRRLSRHIPGVDPGHIDGGGVRVETVYPGGDLTQMLYMQDLLPEAYHTEFNLASVPATPPLKTLIFRHDSFGDLLYPYINRFSAKVINIAPFAPYRFEALEREHPQAVIHVFAERYIPQALQDDFFYREEKM